MQTTISHSQEQQNTLNPVPSLRAVDQLVSEGRQAQSAYLHDLVADICAAFGRIFHLTSPATN